MWSLTCLCLALPVCLSSPLRPLTFPLRAGRAELGAGWRMGGRVAAGLAGGRLEAHTLYQTPLESTPLSLGRTDWLGLADRLLVALRRGGWLAGGSFPGGAALRLAAPFSISFQCKHRFLSLHLSISVASQTLSFTFWSQPTYADVLAGSNSLSAQRIYFWIRSYGGARIYSRRLGAIPAAVTCSSLANGRPRLDGRSQ